MRLKTSWNSLFIGSLLFTFGCLAFSYVLAWIGKDAHAKGNFPTFVFENYEKGAPGKEVHLTKILPADRFEKLVVQSDSGDIHIKLSADDQIHVAFSGHLSSEQEAGWLVEDRSARTLMLNLTDRSQGTFPFINWSSSSSKLEVALPQAKLMALTVHVGSGDVLVERVGFSRVEVKSGSGDLELHLEGAGELILQTGSGEIDLDGKVKRIDVDTGSGDVKARLGESPTQLKISTGSGDVELRAPSLSGWIRTKTGSGDVSNSLGTSGGPEIGSIRTGSGDITISK